MLNIRLRHGLACGAMALALSLPAQAASETNNDPWEGFNRAMFSFNDGVDKYALKPIAQGYHYVVPGVAQKGVTNFFSNLGDVRTMLNDLLQGKVRHALQDGSRVVFNSTFGLAGLIDVATPMGIEKHDEDFGQTLGYWGLGSGPYLVLPFLGPSSVRDGIGLVPDMSIDPVGDVGDIPTRNSLYGLRMIDARVRLLKAEQIISGDRYLFIRDAYLQRRQYLVNDGKVTVHYDDSDF